ncbi:MAG TPA: cobalamin-binding protein [Dehalococcoidia bacterium]
MKAVRVVDAVGREVLIPYPPRRIVSLVPSLTEALFAFGAGEQVVGVTRFCTEPPEGVAAKAKVGGTKKVQYQAVRDLEPDLVIASAEENRKEDVAPLIIDRIPIFVTLPTTVEEAVQQLRVLARIVGREEEARPVLEDAEAAVAELRAARTARPPVSVFCPVWRRPYVHAGPGTYLHDVLELCGGTNLFADRPGRYFNVTLEEMADRNPDVILLPDEPFPYGEQHLPEFQAFTQVTAVREGRVHLIDGKLVTWYGPRMAASLRTVHRILHPA